MSTPAIELSRVSLTYRLLKERPDSRITKRFPWASHWKATHEVNAVRDVSLRIERGSTVGVIGSNGAGKSTLLRLMAGILKPNHGAVQTQGKISTLLSLGVGFRPQLTGRENAILAGLAAGNSRQVVLSQIDSVLEFADLGEFADLPLRTYSSGMSTRLGFAVASSMIPEILLIDEALSAGDADFRQKAQSRITELIAEANTLVLVSHSMNVIQELCQRTVWISQGRVHLDGPSEEVCGSYLESHRVGQGHIVTDDL